MAVAVFEIVAMVVSEAVAKAVSEVVAMAIAMAVFERVAMAVSEVVAMGTQCDCSYAATPPRRLPATPHSQHVRVIDKNRKDRHEA